MRGNGGRLDEGLWGDFSMEGTRPHESNGGAVVRRETHRAHCEEGHPMLGPPQAPWKVTLSGYIGRSGDCLGTVEAEQSGPGRW